MACKVNGTHSNGSHFLVLVDSSRGHSKLFKGVLLYFILRGY